MASVVAFGEAFADIDWFDDGWLKAQLGGSCANVTTEVSIMGGYSAIITKLSNDSLGRFVLRSLSDYGVNTELVVMSNEKAHNNSLNIICRSSMGAEYLIYNHGCVEQTLTEEEIRFDEIAKYDVFHFGSNPIASPTAGLVDKCIDYARKHGCKISYDVNNRPGFWANSIEATQTINKYVQKSDYIKMNEPEANLCAGELDDITKSIDVLSKKYKDKILIITCSEKGSYILNQGKITLIAPKMVTRCDDVGAGDAYYAVFLRLLCVSDTTNENYVKIANIASDISALSVKFHGTISAFKEALLEYGFKGSDCSLCRV